MVDIGIYVGDGNDPVSNVSPSLGPWTRYLSENHNVDLFGGVLPFENADSRCRQLKSTAGSPNSIIGKLTHGYRICVNYCKVYSPDVLIQFWKYPVHAPIIVSAGLKTNTNTILRYNGDVFNQHRGFSGAAKYLTQVFNTPSKIAPRFADSVIVFGPYGERELVRRGVSRQSIHTLPPSSDIGERFTPPDDKGAVKEKLDLPTDKTVALYVGRIESLKGMDYLGKIAARIEAHDRVQFVLVGGGPGESDFPDHKIANVFDDRTVRVEGKVPHDEIYEYYQAADVYVHPSPYEGIPLTVLEAAQCDLPVVARPAGDIPLIAPNIVRGPMEMAQTLLQGSWQEGWVNNELFSEEYQRSTLNAIVTDMYD